MVTQECIIMNKRNIPIENELFEFENKAETAILILLHSLINQSISMTIFLISIGNFIPT